MANEYFSFFAVRRSASAGEGPSYSFGSEDHVRTSVNKWKAEKCQETEALESEVNPSEGKGSAEAGSDFTHLSALTDALAASVDFGLAQYELIEASTLAPVLIEMAMATGLVIGPTAKSADKIDTSDTADIYGLNEAQFADLLKRNRRFGIARKGFERFPSATFLSVVATFDTLIVDVMAKMLRLQSEWLEKSERSLSVSRLAKANSIEELINEQIAEELYQFSRGSHSEQASYIRRNFGIDIPKHWKRWPDYIEIFERRNLVAHGEANFNARYASICTREGHKGSDKLIGEEVRLSKSYLNQSLEVLMEFAVLLSFSLFRKFVAEKEEEAFTNLNEAAFKLIQHQQYVVAERICAYALSLEKTKITEEARLMLLVNRASALRHIGMHEDAKRLLDENDWSATSDIFKVCVSSVRGDVDQFVSLLAPLKSAGKLDSYSILNWPCFSFMMEDEKAKASIRDVFEIGESATVIADDASSQSKLTDLTNNEG